jgi:hypothetical protein
MDQHEGTLLLASKASAKNPMHKSVTSAYYASDVASCTAVFEKIRCAAAGMFSTKSCILTSKYCLWLAYTPTAAQRIFSNTAVGR